MNNVIVQLRKKNKEQYTLLSFCTILAVVLVSSYAVMFFSPTVQNILPIGGDSRKQAWMIFAIAIAGCGIFTTYASSLFFRYKSREFGVFMALGTKKSALKKVLLKELGFIIPLCALIGLALSIPVSFLIWKFFQIFIVNTDAMAYHISWEGLLFGLGFCLFVIICVFIMGVIFIKRSNLMDMIYQQKKTETVKEAKSWYGILGWILFIGGILLGYGLPITAAEIFKYELSPLWQSTFLLSLIGIYFIIMRVVIYRKKGKNPDKYYKNIVSTGMMRFLGRQTVRNMCIITLLIAGALFAVFYIPTIQVGTMVAFAQSPVQNNFFYKATENQISEAEIRDLAFDYNTEVTAYTQLTAAKLIINVKMREYGEDSHMVVTYIDKGRYGDFFSASDYNRLTGQNVKINSGEYKRLIFKGESQGYWDNWDDLDLITSPVTGESTPIKYTGNATYTPLVKEGLDTYIISDADYKQYCQGLTKENQDIFVLFDVRNQDDSYDFATALKNEIIQRSSKSVAVPPYYDAYEEKIAKEKGEIYSPSAENNIVLSKDNKELALNWKYYPNFGILNKLDFLENTSVYIMLFVYIALVCFAAVGVIAYTRSITLGINNKDLFDDLKRLGANKKYIENVIKQQLVKLFFYPTAVGSLAIMLFYTLILYGNSGGNFNLGEILALVVDMVIIIIVGLFMYFIYRLSLKKVKKIINL
ncbi:MAG: FtsX-like permease family protein [Clostridiales bacterium]